MHGLLLRGLFRLVISIALVFVTLAAARRHGLAATELCLLDVKSMLTEGSWPEIPETKASLKQELMVTAFSFAKAPSKGIRHNKAKFRIMMLTD